MAGVGRDPSPNELLDRIMRLEKTVSTLQRENTSLKARMDDLVKAFKFQAVHLGDGISHINDFLWPLVHKIFPEFRRTQDQLDSIVPACTDATVQLDAPAALKSGDNAS